MRTDEEIKKAAFMLGRDDAWGDTSQDKVLRESIADGFRLVIEILLDIRAAIIPDRKPITISLPGLKEERDAARKTP